MRAIALSFSALLIIVAACWADAALWGSSGFSHPVALLRLLRGHSCCDFSHTLASVSVMRKRIDMRETMPVTLSERRGQLEMWQTPIGPFWIPAGDSADLRDEIAEELASDVYRVQSGSVHAGDVVLDCGANVGTFTRLCLQHGAKTVVAIEPAPATVECLRRTFAAEIQRGVVIVYPKGVWDEEGSLRLQVVPGMSEANTFVLHPELKDGPTIPVTTIDKLIAELHLESVSLIKMDIEGAEQRALRGASSAIRRLHPRLAISAHHLPDDPVRIPKIVHQLAGYREELGYCHTIWNGDVMPGVIHFYPL